MLVAGVSLLKVHSLHSELDACNFSLKALLRHRSRTTHTHTPITCGDHVGEHIAVAAALAAAAAENGPE